MKRFNIIVAYNESKGIGYKNELPWPKITKDMSRFANITSTTQNKEKINAVIMGKNTWDSIPKMFRPLKNRLNIILSSNPKIKEEEINNNAVQTYNSFEAAHEKISQNPYIESIFVIGGEQVYSNTINSKYVDKVYITELQYDCVVDKYFPKFDESNKFTMITSESAVDKNTNIGMTFKTFQNIQDINSDEYQYIDLVDGIITQATSEHKNGRNGGVLSTFSVNHTFDLQKGFPLLTTKKMYFKGIYEELWFFINGFTDSTILKDKGNNIWNGNTTREFLDSRKLYDRKVGDMGPMYGFNWRHFGATYSGCNTDYTGQGYDQLYALIDGLTNDPHSRRHLLTTYDPSKVDESVLAPCHGISTQFYIRDNKYLDCKMNQRSADIGLGYPYNIASYALFTHIICHVTGYLPGKLHMSLGDAHIYDTHVEQLKIQIKRSPLLFPQLMIDKDFDAVNSTVTDKLKFMESFLLDNIKMVGYASHPMIRMEMSA